jgi:dTDP-4-dehydrorhamnose 3,5-epimerase
MDNSAIKIDGVLLNKLNQFHDQRGAVYHYMKFSSAGFTGFGEVYFSKIFSKVVKGWKLHKNSCQNFCVPYGKLKVVLFDNRSKSATKGLIDEIYLNDSDKYCRLTIPQGIWYAFQSLSDDFTLLTNLINIEHDPSETENLPLDSTEIKYQWIK